MVITKACNVNFIYRIMCTLKNQDLVYFIGNLWLRIFVTKVTILLERSLSRRPDETMSSSHISFLVSHTYCAMP